MFDGLKNHWSWIFFYCITSTASWIEWQYTAFSYAVQKANENKGNKMWAELKVASLFKIKTKTNYFHVFSVYQGFLLFFSVSTEAPKVWRYSLYFWKEYTGFSSYIFQCLLSFKVFLSLLFRLSSCKTQQTGGGLAGAEDVDDGSGVFYISFGKHKSVTRAYPSFLWWESPKLCEDLNL